MLDKIRAWLFAKLYAVAMSRDPDLWVGGKDDPYMRRWWIMPRNRLFNIYLHCFHRDDADTPHDHPWFSLSWLLKGKLIEWTFARPSDHDVWLLKGAAVGPSEIGARLPVFFRREELKAGRFVIRSPWFAHRLQIPDSWRGATWTLFITGPVFHSWGFHCPNGWVDHKDFNQLSNGVSVADRGCGESA